MKKLAAILSFSLMSTFSYAGNQDNSISSLSPELKQIFSKEMIKLNQGMQGIMAAYISGEWSSIVPIAKKMESSYVLKQSLSKDQMHELHSKLPDNFLELDEKFHYYAGMLAHAAEMNKIELIGFYYAKMSESCVSCHSVYASGKFPSFSSGHGKKEGHH